MASVFDGLFKNFSDRLPKVELDHTAKDRIGPVLDRQNTTTDGALRYIFRDKYTKNVLAGVNEFYGEVLKVISNPVDFDYSEYNELDAEIKGQAAPKSSRYKIWIYGRPYECFVKPKTVGENASDEDKILLESLPDAVVALNYNSTTELSVGDRIIVTFSNLETFSNPTIVRKLNEEAIPDRGSDGDIGTPSTAFADTTPQAAGAPVTPSQNNAGTVKDERESDLKRNGDGFRPGDIGDMKAEPLGPFSNVEEPPPPNDRLKKATKLLTGYSYTDNKSAKTTWYITTKLPLVDPYDFNTTKGLTAIYYGADYRAMLESAKSSGVYLRTNDSLRTQGRQARLYKKYKEGNGNLAGPADGIFRGGHGNASAFDIGGTDGFDGKGYQWLFYNAHKYKLFNNGRYFIPQRESWHWQYTSTLSNDDAVILKRYTESDARNEKAWEEYAKRAEKQNATDSEKLRAQKQGWIKDFSKIKLPQKIINAKKHE